MTDLGAVPGIGYATGSTSRNATRLSDAGENAQRVDVADEVPVALVYNGRSHVVVMASPMDLEDLAVGFTLTERIVEDHSEIGGVEVVRHSRGIELQATIPEARAAALDDRRRGMAARSGCGLCGVEALDEVLRTPPRVVTRASVDDDALWRAGKALNASQPLNDATRAVHAAAFCSQDGAVVTVREDIGRHNALDKVIGALARERRDPSRGFVVITSRASYELVIKTAMARIPLLAAVSRPTSLAIQLAEQTGVALVGLLRGESAVRYTS